MTTSVAGFDYLTGALSKRDLATPWGDRDYAAGVIVHGWDKIPGAIESAHALATPEAAPVYQLSVVREVRKFAAALEPFVALVNGWNGPLSEAPSPESVMMAMKSCVALVASGIPSPNPQVFSNGALGGYWKNGQMYAAMDFEDDGEHVWTVTNGEKYTSGTWKINEALPEAIDNITGDTQHISV